MTCTAPLHNTLHAYKKWRCRCPKARAAKAAADRRWPSRPPARHIDPVAVARACLGDRSIHLTPTERGAAIRRLTAKGRSQAWIADQLGISTRTVARHRTTHRTAA